MSKGPWTISSQELATLLLGIFPTPEPSRAADEEGQRLTLDVARQTGMMGRGGTGASLRFASSRQARKVANNSGRRVRQRMARSLGGMTRRWKDGQPAWAVRCASGVWAKPRRMTDLPRLRSVRSRWLLERDGIRGVGSRDSHDIFVGCGSAGTRRRATR